MKAHTLLRNQKIGRYNDKVLALILRLSLTRIAEQGGGCFSEMGSEYFHKGKRDAIYIVCNKIPNIKRYFGVISEESQKPIVKHIVKKFQYNYTLNTEIDKLRKFLQELQDAHDETWDTFSGGDGLMKTFVTKCQEIVVKFGLNLEIQHAV